MSLPRMVMAVVALVALLLPTVLASASPPVRSWPEYFAVKTVMQRVSETDPRVEGQRGEQERHEGGTATYDMVNCLRGADYAGTERAPEIKAYADIALDVIIWRNAFRRFAFPAALWQKPLTDYEQTQVDRTIAGSPPGPEDAATDRFQRSIVARLNGYGASHRAVPRLVLHGGCGAGEGSVLIATAPVGAQVLFIPTFFYELCKVQRQNADDPGSCPRWREAIEGKLQSVAGDYLYRVRWPDGATRRGTLRFDLGDDGKTITLRKP
jgi:hypothetical protein